MADEPNIANRPPPLIVERVEAVFRGQSYRVVRETLTGADPGNRKLIATPEVVMFHTDDVGPDGRKAVLMVGEPAEFASLSSRYLLDPRLLGMKIGPLHALFHASQLESRLDDCIARPKQPELTVTTEEREDGILYQIAYRVPQNNVDIAFTLSPSRGSTMTHGESRIVLATGRSIADTIQLESTPHEALSESGELDEVWYPEIVRYTRSIDGELGFFEETRVLEAEFNIDVDPSEFELASLNAPIGTHVVDRPTFFTQVWDGKQLGPLIAADSVSDPVLELEAKPGRGWFLLAVNLGVLSILLFVWYVRRRRQSQA